MQDERTIARRQRKVAAERYRPEGVRLLLVAEAPPSALSRYFYFEDVREHDSLFRYVVEAVLKEAPSRSDKPAQLSRLRDHGVFLIDLRPIPRETANDSIGTSPTLSSAPRSWPPENVVTIKANVCSLCQEPLRAAGLNVIDQRIPFPGSGQQQRFVDGMKCALSTLDWQP